MNGSNFKSTKEAGLVSDLQGPGIFIDPPLGCGDDTKVFAQKSENVAPPFPRPRRGLGNGAVTFSIGRRTGRNVRAMSHESGQNGSHARPGEDLNGGDLVTGAEAASRQRLPSG